MKTRCRTCSCRRSDAASLTEHNDDRVRERITIGEQHAGAPGTDAERLHSGAGGPFCDGAEQPGHPGPSGARLGLMVAVPRCSAAASPTCERTAESVASLALKRSWDDLPGGRGR